MERPVAAAMSEKRLCESFALSPNVLLDERRPQLQPFLGAVLEHSEDRLPSETLRPPCRMARLASVREVGRDCLCGDWMGSCAVGSPMEVREPHWIGAGFVQLEQLEIFVPVDFENVVFLARFDADDVPGPNVVLVRGVQDLRFATTDQIELVGVVIVAVVLSPPWTYGRTPRVEFDTTRACYPALEVDPRCEGWPSKSHAFCRAKWALDVDGRRLLGGSRSVGRAPSSNS